MKITKKQLNRIIAEEYALVQKKKLASKGKSNSKAKRQRMLERKQHKQQIIIEAKAKLIAREIMEEGWFTDALAGIGGVLGQAGEKVGAQVGKVGKMADDTWKATKKAYMDAAKENQDKAKAAAMKKVSEDAESTAQAAFEKWMQQMVSILLKGGYEDEEAKEAVLGLSSGWQAAVPTDT